MDIDGVCKKSTKDLLQKFKPAIAIKKLDEQVFFKNLGEYTKRDHNDWMQHCRHDDWEDNR